MRRERSDGEQFKIAGAADAVGRLYFRGQRLPASYANFYIANGLVLMPTFHDPNDRSGTEHYGQEVFPEREVIGI